MRELKQLWHGTKKGYLIGLFLSLLLTITSFTLVYLKLLTPYYLTLSVAVLAFVQAVFQLRYFLHLGSFKKSTWENLLFILMVVVVLIIVLGSLWVMDDLNFRTMRMDD